jgi:hypothetical protein
MKTKTEIINETATYYSEDISKRAKNGGDCSYFKNNKMCAVGRCLINPGKVEKETIIALENCKIESTSVQEFKKLYNNLDDLLQEEYRGHDFDFWQALQNLHDYDHNWDNYGLSERGEREVKFLLELYKGK